MTERDPHLLAALRHAPDHDALPSREVSERILAAAHAAVRPAPVAPAWQRWLLGLAQPRVAAVFGALAMATIVGVMWATHDARAPAGEAADTPPARVAEREAAPHMAAAAPARAEGEAAPVAPSEQARQKPLAPATAAAKRTTTEPRADVAAVPAATGGKASARQEVVVAAAPPAERTAAAAEPAIASPQPPAAAPPAPVAAATTNLGGSTGALADAGAAGSTRSAASARQTSSTALQANARATDLGASLDASVQAGPAWVLPAGRRVQGDEQRRWWAEVRSATAGRWQVAEHAPTGAAALEWEAGGSTVVRFWFDGDALVCRDTEGRVWRAAVGAAAVRGWQAELARW